MMPEGGVYLCNWSRAKGSFTLALRANPNLQSTGPDLEQCMENICLQIIEWNGDGEAVLELFPPRAGKRFEGGAVLFCSVGYNDDVRTSDYTTLFDGGACPTCKFGLGERSDARLLLQARPRGLVCAVDACYPIILVFHDKFIASLTDEERAAFEIRPAEIEGEGNESEYSELIAKETVRTVGYRGADYPTAFQQSFKCGECGREKFETDAKGFDPGTSFVRADDIDGKISTMMSVDDGWCCSPAFRLSRWKQLLADRNLRGLLSKPVAVLEANHAETPSLPICKEFDWVL